MIITAVRVAAVAVAAAVAGSSLATLPAHAQGSEGKVIARTGLVVRYSPSANDARSPGNLPYGKVIPIECKVRGTIVDGNDLWYSLPPDTHEWVSARYVENIGAAPGWCTGGSKGFTGRATAGLSARRAPNTSDTKVGSYAKGATISIVCKVDGQGVYGNPRWYYTSKSSWVSARYVSNVGAAPGWGTD
ncbi:MAG: hypothetical protein ACR2I1_00470 [Propionibacteriaceae bacterium]